MTLETTVRQHTATLHRIITDLTAHLDETRKFKGNPQHIQRLEATCETAKTLRSQLQNFTGSDLSE